MALNPASLESLLRELGQAPYYSINPLLDGDPLIPDILGVILRWPGGVREISPSLFTSEAFAEFWKTQASLALVWQAQPLLRALSAYGLSIPRLADLEVSQRLLDAGRPCAPPPPDDQWLDLFRDQLQQIRHWGLIEVCRLEYALLPVLARMEVNGLPLSSGIWQEEIDRAQTQAEEALDSIRRELRPPADFQPNEASLQALMDSHHIGSGHPLGEALHQWRKAQQILTHYAGWPQLVHPRTQRLHPMYDALGTETGRIIAHSPAIQQLPRRLRRAIAPGDGECLISCDYSQIELRVLAALSQDPYLIHVFQEGKDLHAQTAASILGISETAVTPEDRQRAKAINFGLLYGRGAQSLSHELGTSTQEASRWIRAHLDRFPGSAKFLNESAKQAVKERLTRSGLGRIRHYPHDQPDSTVERKGRNHPIQGTASDILKLALIATEQAVTPLGGRLLTSIHDEILIQAPREQASEIASRATQAMVQAAIPLLGVVTPQVDQEIAQHWP